MGLESVGFITDCHSHFWAEDALSPPWTDDLVRVPSTGASFDRNNITVEAYRAGTAPATRSIVFGLQGRAAGIFVPNDAVASFARAAGPSTVGFLSVDPTSHSALDELDRAVDDLGLVGVKLGLPYQAVSPTDPRAMRVFREAERRSLPVLVHQGAIFTTSGRMMESNPLLLDDVAIAFPNLVIVVAHMGHPWVHETAVVMRRHRNVYADLSAVARRPAVLEMALVAAKEYGVFDKLLFGSDFPMVTGEQTIAALRAVAAHTRRFSLTPVGDDEIDSILYRDTFAVLGIPAPRLSEDVSAGRREAAAAAASA